MGFQDPRPGYPQPNVDSDFCGVYTVATFATDHVIDGSGVARWCIPHTVSGVAVWTTTTSAAYTITLDTYHMLQVAHAQTDGSFTTTADVTYADGTVIARGTAGRLQAQVVGGVHVAVPVSIPGRGLHRGTGRAPDASSAAGAVAPLAA